jgi:hypothetical protein
MASDNSQDQGIGSAPKSNMGARTLYYGLLGIASLTLGAIAIAGGGWLALAGAAFIGLGLIELYSAYKAMRSNNPKGLEISVKATANDGQGMGPAQQPQLGPAPQPVIQQSHDQYVSPPQDSAPATAAVSSTLPPLPTGATPSADLLDVSATPAISQENSLGV